MTASDFVKKYGVEAAKALLAESTGCSLYVDMNYKATIYQHDEKPRNCDEIDFIVHRDDLKRLVESHELVESLGGLELAKRNLVTTDRALGYTHVYLHSSKTYCFLDKSVDYIISDKAIEIKLAIKAIADVESCQ